MQASDKNYIRTESRNGSESSFLGSSRFPCCGTAPCEDPPKEGVIPRTFRPEGLACATTQGNSAAAKQPAGTRVTGLATGPAAATDEAHRAQPVCAAAQPFQLQPQLREAGRRIASASAPTHPAAVRG